MKQQYYESNDRLEIELLKRYALILLAECRDDPAPVLRTRVRSALTHEQLLRLRGAMFECISMHLGEAEAMDRIRSLDNSA